MPIPYDFTPGDNLLSALKQASQKLQDFIALRGRLAQTDLSYQVVGGQLQGWVGGAYNDFKRQFDISQNDLVSPYLDQLNKQYVNVNNILYDIELRIYKTASRTLLSVPPLPAAPPLAPDNNATKPQRSVEGATPVCLYDYSDQTTGSNDQIRPFFWKQLPDAANAFPDYTIVIADITDNIPGLAQSILSFLRYRILVLDARVRIVGQAFETADSTFNDHRFDTLPSQAMVNDIADKIAKNAGESSQQGADAAKKLHDKTEDLPSLMQQIRQHQDDPAWTSAFFSNLSYADILGFIYALGNLPQQDTSALSQAYVTALGAGQLSPSSISDLTTLFLHNGPDGTFDNNLIQDLKDDPGAAASFLNDASDEELQSMLNGDFSPQNHSQGEAQIIDLATTVLQSSGDPDTARQFYDRMSRFIMNTNPSDAETVLPKVQKFFGSYIYLATTPPPAGAGPDALKGWAKQVSGNLDGQLNQWADWISKSEAKVRNDQSSRESAQSFIIGSLAAVATMPLDPAVSAEVGIMLSVEMSAHATWIDQQLNPGDYPLTGDPIHDYLAMRDVAKSTTKYVVAVNAIAAGDVIGRNGPVTLNEINTVLANPSDYTIRGSSTTLDDFLGNDVGNQF